MYLDASASGIGPLVCPDLYHGDETKVKFDRTAIACAVMAIKFAVKDTAAEDVIDDVDDADIDPAALMALVVEYIQSNDTDSSLVLERALDAIKPTPKGTRVEQVGQMYKDIKAIQRKYKAHGLMRGPDYFVTRARLLIAQYYPDLTFSSDRQFKTLQKLFQEYHYRAADADELEQRTADTLLAAGGTTGAFPATGGGGGGNNKTRNKERVKSVAYTLGQGEPLPFVGQHWCDTCKTKVSHKVHAPWCADCKKFHQGSCADFKARRGGGRDNKSDHKRALLTAEEDSKAAAESHKAYVAEQDRKQTELQDKLDASRALVAKYQTSGQYELPGGPP